MNATNQEIKESLRKTIQLFEITCELVDKGLTDEEILSIEANSPYYTPERTKLVVSMLKSLRGQ